MGHTNLSKQQEEFYEEPFKGSGTCSSTLSEDARSWNDRKLCGTRTKPCLRLDEMDGERQ
jgi:hypothetical protein